MNGVKKLESRGYVLKGCFMVPCGVPAQPAMACGKKYDVEVKNVDYLDGESRKIVQQDYPITPEYVGSFVEATDFRHNPAAFMSPRQNLGDVRDVQNAFKNGGLSDIRAEIDKLREALSVAEQKLQSQESASVVASQEKSEGEVKENV